MDEVFDIVDSYKIRKGKKQEKELFFVANILAQDENYNDSLFHRTNEAICRYLSIKNMIDAVDPEIIKSNIYLSSAKKFLNSSLDDCSDLLLDVMDNSDAEELTINKFYSDIGIMREEGLPVNVVDLETAEELKDVYDTYNNIVKNVNGLFCEIYRLQLFNMSRIIPESDIDPYSVVIEKHNELDKVRFNFRKCHDNYRVLRKDKITYND